MIKGLRPSRRAALRGLAAATALCAAAQVNVGVASAATVVSVERAGASAERAAVADLLATGRVVRAGQPVVGADVLLIVWPIEDPDAPLPEGAVVPTVRVPVGKTDADGKFLVTLAPSTLTGSFAPTVGVDFELVVGDAAQEASWFFTAATDGSRWLDSKAPADKPASEDVTVDLSTGRALSASNAEAFIVDENDNEVADKSSPVLVRSRGARLPSIATTVSDVTSRTRSTSAGPVSHGCIESAGPIHYGLGERFVNVYAWSGAPATIRSSNSHGHEIGVGLQDTGGYWSAGGTVSRTVEAFAEDSNVIDKAVYNKMNYRDYNLYNCSGYYIGKARRPHSYHSLHVSFGLISHTTFATTATSCTNYSSGTRGKTTGANTVFSQGMDLSVVKVSANVSHDKGFTTTWTFSKPSKLCGNTSSGWASSPTASASGV